MKWWFKSLLAFLVAVELVFCAIFGYRVYTNLTRRKDVLGAQYVTRISKESVIFPEVENLKDYYEPKPNSTESEHPDWLPYTATFTYNSEGLRAERDYTLQKESGVFRIIALGDSFTVGAYVNNSDTYENQLERLLNEYARTCTLGRKFEVINLGVNGYDIPYAVERYRRHGQKYQPDLVIWLINEHNVLMLNDLLMPLQWQIENAMSEEEKAQHYREKDYYYASIKAREQLEGQYSEAYIFSQQRQALDSFSAMYRGPLLIVMFAGSSQKTMDVIASYARDRTNTYFFDSLAPLSREDGTALPDFHPSVSGQALIANHIFQYLTDKQLVPCLSIPHL